MKDILIVEDGKQEQLRLLRLAAAANYSAKAVGGVEEATKEINNERYRLIILDLGLEDQSGLHLFRRLQELSHPPQVIVLTGNPSTHLKQRFLDEGVIAYLYKGTQAASNDSISEILLSVLSDEATASDISYREMGLTEFLRDFVTAASRELFYQQGSVLPKCQCGASEYKVVFSHCTQLPPVIEGQVCCVECGSLLDVELS